MFRLFVIVPGPLREVSLAIVELSGDFGFAHNSLKHPCTLASFSRARMPRSACTRDITCELYCRGSLPKMIMHVSNKIFSTALICIAQIQNKINLNVFHIQVSSAF